MSVWLKSGLSLLFSATIQLACLTRSDASLCTGESSVDRVLLWAQSIATYSLTTDVRFEGQTLSGRIWGEARRTMRLELTFVGQGRPFRWLQVFDGKHQWVETHAYGRRQIMRTKLSMVTRSERPFDTGLNVYGSGLLSGEDFPGTIVRLASIYDYQAECKPERTVLRGTLSKQRFFGYVSGKTTKWSKDQIDSYGMNFGFSEIDVSPSGAVVGYRLGPKTAANTVSVEFREIRVNQRLDSALFRFKPPARVPIVDFPQK